MQGHLYKAERDSLFWLKQRGLTVLYYQYELQDSLREILREILKAQAEESPYLLMDAYGESLLSEIRTKKISPEASVGAFTFWDNLYRNLDMIHPTEYEAAEDLHLVLVDALYAYLPDCTELENEYGLRMRRSLLSPEEYEFIYTVLRLKGCESSAFQEDILDRMLKLVPSSYFLRLVADEYLEEEAYAKAQTALEKALEFPQSDRIRAKNLLLLAELYSYRKSFRTARLTALQADRAYPEWGEPWLFQAELSLKSAYFCNFSELERKALHWLAIDYCEKAMNLNETLTVAARSRIALYQKSCPELEEILFHGFKVGDSFPIPCWIGETTRVRY